MQDGKPSFTAYIIAKTIAELGRTAKYEKLVTVDQVAFSGLFAQKFEEDNFRVKLMSQVVRGKLLFFILDRFFIKGLPTHYAARKKYIRTALKAEIEKNPDLKQVITIGAGFDTLSAEYCQRYHGIKFIELDHPATQRIKRKVLTGSDNFELLSCDLSVESIKKALARSVLFRNSSKTAVIIEGVLMYLTAEEVDKLFNDLQEILGNGSFVIFGSMDRLKSAKARDVIADKALSMKSEKYKFALSEADIKKFLSEKGFNVVDFKNYADLQNSSALSSERGENYYLAVKSA